MSAGRGFRRRLARGGVVYLLPAIPDGSDQHVKNGLAARAVTARTGRCPLCGSDKTVTVPVTAGVDRVLFIHESDCLAGDQSLDAHGPSVAVTS